MRRRRTPDPLRAAGDGAVRHLRADPHRHRGHPGADTEKLNQFINDLADVTEGQRDDLTRRSSRRSTTSSVAINEPRHRSSASCSTGPTTLSATLAEKDETLVALIDQSRAILDLLDSAATSSAAALGEGSRGRHRAAPTSSTPTRPQLDQLLDQPAPDARRRRRQPGRPQPGARLGRPRLLRPDPGRHPRPVARHLRPRPRPRHRHQRRSCDVLGHARPASARRASRSREARLGRRRRAPCLASLAAPARAAGCSAGRRWRRRLRGHRLLPAGGVALRVVPGAGARPARRRGHRGRDRGRPRPGRPAHRRATSRSRPTSSAALVPQSLIGERYVQLIPAWIEGEEPCRTCRPTSAVIDLDGSIIPVEPDEALAALNEFLDTLDPDGLGRLIANAADDLEGNGQNLNDALESITDLVEHLRRARRRARLHRRQLRRVHRHPRHPRGPDRRGHRRLRPHHRRAGRGAQNLEALLAGLARHQQTASTSSPSTPPGSRTDVDTLGRLAQSLVANLDAVDDAARRRPAARRGPRRRLQPDAAGHEPAHQFGPLAQAGARADPAVDLRRRLPPAVRPGRHRLPGAAAAGRRRCPGQRAGRDRRARRPARRSTTCSPCSARRRRRRPRRGADDAVDRRAGRRRRRRGRRLPAATPPRRSTGAVG